MTETAETEVRTAKPSELETLKIEIDGRWEP